MCSNAREYDISFHSKKSSRIFRMYAWLLDGSSSFLESWTSVGRNVFYPASMNSPWDDYKRAGLETEIAKHQSTLPVWLSALLYCAFPLPFFFAWYRWKVERAYLQARISTEATELPADLHEKFIERLVYASWAYSGWCWPKFLMVRYLKRWLYTLMVK